MNHIPYDDPHPALPTVGALFQQWYRSVQYRIKDSTAANYRMKAQKHILPAFRNLPIDAITADQVYAFIAAKQAEGLSDRYVADILILLKSLFKHAAQTYQIFNPVAAVVLPRRKTPEVALLNSEQQRILWHYITDHPSHTTLGIALSLTTGIRIGELCALQWQDLDLSGQVLAIRKTIQRIQCDNNAGARTQVVITEPKSESSRRCIPIPNCTMPLLRPYANPGPTYVLTGRDRPLEPRTMQYRFARLLQQMQLPPIHFHALRHIFATTCIGLGFDVKALSEILGHSNVEITLNRYVHSSFEQKRAYMERIEIGG